MALLKNSAPTAKTSGVVDFPVRIELRLPPDMSELLEDWRATQPPVPRSVLDPQAELMLRLYRGLPDAAKPWLVAVVRSVVENEHDAVVREAATQFVKATRAARPKPRAA
jgi:hypothetical protein